MIRAATIAALVALPFCAAPAAAQNGAMWTDEVGRMVSLTFSNLPEQPLPPRDRSPAEMAMLFKQLCVDTNAGAQAIEPVAAALGLAPQPYTIAATKKMAAITLPIWRGEGLIVSQTDGFFAAKEPQCGALFYVATLPDRTAVEAALTQALGTPPSNATDAIRKDGKPNRRYQAGWTLDVQGVRWTALANVSRNNEYSPGNRVQISLRASGKKAN